MKIWSQASAKNNRWMRETARMIICSAAIAVVFAASTISLSAKKGDEKNIEKASAAPVSVAAVFDAAPGTAPASAAATPTNSTDIENLPTATASVIYTAAQIEARDGWFSAARQSRWASRRAKLSYLTAPLLAEIYLAASSDALSGSLLSSAAPAMPPGGPTAFDFDGDSKADYAVWTPSTGMWTIRNSGSGSVEYQTWGTAGDRIVPADYDGDGKTDIAIWRPASGLYAVIKSTGGQQYFNWGAATDIPVPADYDGDGKADFAVWRPSDGVWYISQSSTANSTYTTFQFGAGSFGDIPVVGDYNGDGAADFAVWRASTGWWYFTSGGSSFYQYFQWGQFGDIPVPADYSGDGITDFAFWRPPGSGSLETSTGQWYIYYNDLNGYIGEPSGGTDYVELGESNPPDMLVPADYNGDGRANVAAWHSTTGDWNVWYSLSGGGLTILAGTPLGTPCDIAVESAYTNQQAPNCDNPPTLPGASANANPNPAAAGATTILTVTVTPGTNPASSGIAVTGDLTAIGGAATQSFTNAGNNVFTFSAQVGAGIGTGAKSLPIKIKDAQHREATVLLNLTVNPSPPSGPTAAAVAKARISPKNETGSLNLYSQNFWWGTGLVGLPGRAGLDAGLSISYNSLMWIKTGSTMVFDPDKSNVSPGFRFGFPVIEPLHTGEMTNKPTYLMVTPSGGRVEFRQTSVASIYETADSSYAQITTDSANNTLLVRTTDGTQMSFDFKGGAYHPNQIKDRNGNYITIVHDAAGLLRTVTDTLGRIITVNYDAQNYPSSITQLWKNNNGGGADITHTYATFAYTTVSISIDFGGLTLSGITNGASVKALQKITFADGSSTGFDYNSYAQVKQITNNAPDGHALNYARTNLGTPAATEPDCPRFTETRGWAESFNGSNGIPAETVTHNTLTGGGTFAAGGESLSPADVVEVWMDNSPDDVHSKTYYYAAGNWAEGLPFGTTDTVSGVLKRWTRSVWTQDDTTPIYKINPRVTESKVGDETNTKRTAMDYKMQTGSTTAAYYGLVTETRIYDADQTTVLKRATTSYNLGNEYLSRYIIGLPDTSQLFDRNNALTAKMSYLYDQPGFTESGQIVAPVQHDNTNYGANLTVGRGNPTKMIRWDVSNQSGPITREVKYDMAGSAVAQIDPTGRTVRIGYADNFNSSSGGGTFAYPTTLTDPNGKSSQVRYRFDIGANVWANSPAPAGNTLGKESVREYDDAGKLIKNQITGGAYVKYKYEASGNYLKVYSTITDTNGDNTAGAADEVLTETWFDGNGRAFKSRTPFTFDAAGETATWKGQKADFDILGRIKNQYVPTEINGNWDATGSDTVWRATSQTYDWKGRVTQEIGLGNANRFYSYEGCGCAGGEVVTMSGEEIEPGKRRKQKVYSDILGRQWKTEIFNYDGSVYTSSVTKFNGRDQAEWVKQYQGAAPSGALSDASCPAPTCQIATSEYDGHGRLKKSHAPQQDAGKFTVYNYYDDDQPQSVTDARGAVISYTYENRGLVETISETMPPDSTVPLSATCGSPNNPMATYQPGDSSTAPVGYMDFTDSASRIICGWSADMNAPSSSNSVAFYMDGLAGQGGISIGSIAADRPRSDVNTVANIPGNHGFEFKVPEQYADGKTHLIYVYGQSVYNTDPQELLTNAPKSIMLVSKTKITSFEYDDLGNRWKVTDQTGVTTYSYDRLSRPTDENKHLRDDWNIPRHDFNIHYEYGFSGQMLSVTDPFNDKINYASSRIGELKSITGTPFNSTYENNTVAVTNYINNIEYRAFGAAKAIDYGNMTHLSQSFDERLQISDFRVWKDGQTTDSIIKKTYQYYNDGRLKFSSDAGDQTQRIDSHRFDRSYEYDQMGRLTKARTGAEARNEPFSSRAEIPYKRDYAYDVFGNNTSRQTFTWTEQLDETHTWTNNRESTWAYDADGRLVGTPENHYDFDARGTAVASSFKNQSLNYLQTDGEGRVIRRDGYERHPANSFDTWLETDYQIYSSVLGKLLSEADKEGRKTRTFVYGAGGQLVATQNIDWNAPSAVRQTVNWEYWDAGGASRMVAAHGGGGLYYSGIYGQAELDPEGSNVGTANPNGTGGAGGGQPDLSQSPGGWGYGSFGDPFGSYSCRVNGFDAPCSLAFRMLSNGSADIDSLHTSDSTLRELNIFAQPVYSYRDTNRPHEPEDPDKIVIYKDIERYLSGYTYWIPGIDIYNVSFSIKDIENRVSKIIENPDCDKFLTRLFEIYNNDPKTKEGNKVPLGTKTINEIFKDVWANTTYEFADQIGDGKADGIHSLISDGKHMIQLVRPPKTINVPHAPGVKQIYIDEIADKLVERFQQGMAWFLFAETLHGSGSKLKGYEGLSDPRLADVAHQAYSDIYGKGSILAPNGDPSVYAHTLTQYACGGNPRTRPFEKR